MIVAEVWHPWEFIAEELAERGWSKLRLALEMGGNRDVNLLTIDILEYSRDPDVMIGASTAGALSRAFGTSPEFWINLHAAWREQIKATPSREGASLEK